jgi:hypothetical protein
MCSNVARHHRPASTSPTNRVNNSATMCQLLETVCRTNAANQGDAAWSKGRNMIRNCVASQLFHSLVPTRDTWGSLTPSVTIESSSWPPTWCGCCFRIVDADRHPVFCWHSKPWSSADSTPLISVDCGAPPAACLSHILGLPSALLVWPLKWKDYSMQGMVITHKKIFKDSNLLQEPWDIVRTWIIQRPHRKPLASSSSPTG